MGAATGEVLLMSAVAVERGDELGEVRALYLEAAPQVRAALRRLTGARAEADDLLHEVFVIAIGQREKLAAAASPRGWLFGIALKVAARHRRRAWIRSWLSLEEAAEPEGGELPVRALERREASALVQAALERLSAAKREVFVLADLEGLSGHEIAAAVGCPLNTVWSRLRHARAEFAVAVAELDGEATR